MEEDDKIKKGESYFKYAKFCRFAKKDKKNAEIFFYKAR
jgi:hypothetical protein